MATQREALPKETPKLEAGDSLDTTSDVEPAVPPLEGFKPNKRFWAILTTLAVIALLSSLENTVVMTTLPLIATQLDLGDNYIWVNNAFFLTK
jgi:hypothetical protein